MRNKTAALLASRQLLRYPVTALPAEAPAVACEPDDLASRLLAFFNASKFRYVELYSN